MLYCTTCRTVVDGGSAICGNCKNGFTSSLACGTCNRVVQRGHAYCSACTPIDRGGVRFDRDVPTGGGTVIRRSYDADPSPPPPPLPSLSLTLPKLPGVSLERAHVPESYVAGQFGAESVVQMNGRDAEILTKMNQVVVLLHALAGEMNDFCHLSDGTRRVIKGCRNLATALQEEVETRRGPSR
jgi:RNA polymerase subunit RPABC4/transcription elongation factor Spt4